MIDSNEPRKDGLLVVSDLYVIRIGDLQVESWFSGEGLRKLSDAGRFPDKIGDGLVAQLDEVQEVVDWCDALFDSENDSEEFRAWIYESSGARYSPGEFWREAENYTRARLSSEVDAMKAEVDEARASIHPAYIRADFQKRRASLLFDMRRRGDEEKCSRCGTDKDITIDHVVAIANGGTNELENLQFLCRSCNCRKGVL